MKVIIFFMVLFSFSSLVYGLMIAHGLSQKVYTKKEAPCEKSKEPQKLCVSCITCLRR